jgi:DNA ligase-1
MLAWSDPWEPQDLIDGGHFPLLGSYKIDGIRALHRGGQLVSRSLKPIPSAWAQKYFADPEVELDGFDGELVSVKVPPGNTLFSQSYSDVMTHGAMEPLNWLIFDIATPDNRSAPYSERHAAIREYIGSFYEGIGVKVLEQRRLETIEDVLAMEQEALDLGHEGLIIRRMDSPYKWGRSTFKEGYLIKLVRVLTSEAEVIGFEERMHNANVPTVDARGYTKRSSSQENLSGLGTLGAFWVRDHVSGAEFKIGTGDGWTDAFRLEVWQNQARYLGRLLKYRFKPCGTKDLPRHPVGIGWRSPDDM